MNFKSIITTAVGLIAFSTVTYASDVSINIDPGVNFSSTFANDSVSRGVSGTNGQPVFSTSAGYTFNVGLYGYVAGNNADNKPITSANAENIVGGGYQTKLGNGDFLLDIGAEYHYFPGIKPHGSATYLNYAELHNTLNWVQTWGTLIGDFSFQPSGQYGAGFSAFTTAGFDVNAPYNVLVSGRFGNATVSNHVYNYNLGAVGPNYQYWSIGVSRNLADVLNNHPLTVALVYSGASISKTRDVDGNAGNRFIGSVSYSF